MNLRRPGTGSLVFIAAAAIFIVSPVRVPTDSRYSTLVSEALLRHGSFALDSFFPAGQALPYQVERIRGHVYSWYPPGGPVLVTPLVGALRLARLSAVAPSGAYDENRDVIVQALIAAFLMALLTSLVFGTARELLPPRWSCVVALGAALGTQIWTTASRALWGDTFLALIFGVVTWLLVRHEAGKQPRSPRLLAALLATLVSWGYFCRPTAVATIAAVTLYVALHHRRSLALYLATGAAWLGAFLVWSRLTFGTFLPTYYRMSAFHPRGFGAGLAGILLSPSRGQLVFVPASMFVAYLVVRYARALALPRLVWPALIAVLGHLALIAAFPLWHGGHSYGPRYLTPLVPWLALLAAQGLRALRDHRGRWTRLELSAGGLLLACGVLVQARGAFARETWTWNDVPANIASRPERVWSWRDAQPLAGLLRPAMPSPSIVPTTLPDARVDLGSVESERYLIPGGWSGSEGDFRWTDGHTAELVFGLEKVEPLTLELDFAPFLPPRRVRAQRIEVELNGQVIDTLLVNRPGEQTIAVPLPIERLARENRLTLHLPDAAFASRFGLGKDPRQLGLAMHWLRIRRIN